MTNEEIRGLNVTELKEKIVSETEALRKVKFAHRISAIENPMKIKETRRLIARLQTALTASESKK
jgi:large subunit ribosomal protein L29